MHACGVYADVGNAFGVPTTPMHSTTMQASPMQATTMQSMLPPSTLTASSSQMGVPLNFQGTQLQGSYMPNPNWRYPSKEQLLQD